MSMILTLTIVILLIYTIGLIIFFARWCSLSSTMFYPQKELPLAAIKSPRWKTKFVEIENIPSNSPSIEQLYRKYSLAINCENSKNGSIIPLSKPTSDYLHPKYSLPALKGDLAELPIYEFEKLLRIPARIPHKKSSTSSNPLRHLPPDAFVV
uniref:Uncharacterized protein n=1 Tax=Panagrellus redivivus TaxID=6233 RepID=A0A7E4VD81_PANRE